MTTRRAFLAAALAAPALALSPLAATAQTATIGGIRIVISPLVQEGWGYHVPAIKAGLEREAMKLAQAVGEGTQVEAFPAVAPPHSEGADCVVVVGSGPGDNVTTTTASSDG